MGLFATRIQALGTENAFKVGVDIARAEAAGKDVIRLNLGEPDFDSPANVNRVACQEIEKGNSHYCDPQGLAALREAIAQHLCLTRGIDASPDRVVVTPGAKPPISYSLQAYVEPGDEVVYPSPGYPLFESFVDYVGARPRPLLLAPETGFTVR
ncbi:MAG: aminotransferase class I/II-fold pyridoxal phosphate-dependent enzyme, partial [Planctomycetes bacterium]|nr:aminotransferase class I/II-fold pyridoxal phosphate-dependent enzyme [Planctomycetota bacterium]